MPKTKTRVRWHAGSHLAFRSETVPRQSQIRKSRGRLCPSCIYAHRPPTCAYEQKEASLCTEKEDGRREVFFMSVQVSVWWKRRHRWKSTKEEAPESKESPESAALARAANLPASERWHICTISKNRLLESNSSFTSPVRRLNIQILAVSMRFVSPIAIFGYRSFLFRLLCITSPNTTQRR